MYVVTTSASAAPPTASNLMSPYSINTSIITPGTGPGNSFYSPLENPLDQVFTLQSPNGQPLNVSIGDLTDYYVLYIQWAIIIGVQIGMCALMFIAVSVLVQPAKRKTIIYKLNLISLACSCIRLIITATYIVGPFSQPYEFLTGYVDQVPSSEFGASIAGTIFYALNIFCVQGSLLLQMRALLVSTAHRWRTPILYLAYLLSLTTIGLVLALTVVSTQNILNQGNEADFEEIPRLCFVSIITSTTYFCVVAITVLSRALWTRRKLGLQQFGPMEIIYLMGLNTMIIPTIFTTIAFTSNIINLKSFYTTLIVIFLPLSSLWATANIEASNSRKNSAASNPILPLRNDRTDNMSGTTVKSSHMTVQLLLSPKTLLDWRKENLLSLPSPGFSVFSQGVSVGGGGSGDGNGEGGGRDEHRNSGMMTGGLNIRVDAA